MSGSKDVKGTEKNNNGSNNGATEFFEFAEKMGEEFTENMSKLTEQWNGQWSSQWGDQMPDWYNSWINELPESFTQDAAKPGTFDLRKNLEDMTGGFGAAALPKIDTAKVLEAQFELLQNYQTLWMNTTAALMQTATGAENDDDEPREYHPEHPALPVLRYKVEIEKPVYPEKNKQTNKWPRKPFEPLRPSAFRGGIVTRFFTGCFGFVPNPTSHLPHKFPRTFLRSGFHQLDRLARFQFE